MKIKNFKALFFGSSLVFFYGALIFLYSECLTLRNSKCLKITNNNFIKTLLVPSKYLKEGAVNTYRIIQNNNKLTHKTPDLFSPNYVNKRFKKYKKKLFFYEYSKNLKGYFLLSAVSTKDGSPVIELWDLEQRKLVKSYDINKKEIIEKIGYEKKYSNKFRILHPILLNDGSIVAIVKPSQIGGKYINGGLIKLDACGKLISFNNGLKYGGFHHSLEIDKFNRIYVPVFNVDNQVLYHNNIRDEKFWDQGFAILDSNLKVKSVHSVSQIFSDLGIIRGALARHFSGKRLNIYHINDVHPLNIDNNPESTVVFISLARYGLLAYHLEDKKPLWVITDATSFQHDINPLDDKGKSISIFDNGLTIENPKNHEGNSILQIFNLPTYKDNVSSKYYIGEHLDKQGLLYKKIWFNKSKKITNPITENQGRGRLLNNNKTIFIEETNNGRAFEVDLSTGNYLWTYLNKEKNEGPILMLSWSRRLESLPKGFNIKNYQKCTK